MDGSTRSTERPEGPTHAAQSVAGYSLVETVVATLLSVAFVSSIAAVSGSALRSQAVADSNGIATDLAQSRWERLHAIPNPSSHADLTPGVHGLFSVDELGSPSVGGPYQIVWLVEAGVPYGSSRRITITVIHTLEPYAHVELVTYDYYRTS